MRKLYLVVALLFISTTAALAQRLSTASIVPLPQSVVDGKGNFTWGINTNVVNKAGSRYNFVYNQFIQLGFSVRNRAPKNNTIELLEDKQLTAPEAYRIEITPQRTRVYFNSVAGANWALATIRQLAGPLAFVIQPKTVFQLPAGTIADAPKFSWRGMHLDVSRHFFDIDYLHKFLDRMALYKFNKFHFHLTDDEGWRVEIKKYPLLTQNGAWREMNAQDSVCIERAKTDPDFILPEKHFRNINGKRMYGGYYTQQQLKDLVKYAAERGIEIIPELDMPGHMKAATDSYPWLTSSGLSPKVSGFSEPICPCKETTFEFAQNIYKEIAEIFPSQYMHLGADEVNRSFWEKSPLCQEFMRQHGFTKSEQIQSYFVHRMEKYFNSIGKKLIGWDEILEGGISPTATLMYWRTWEKTAPKVAAEKGNHIIMTPNEYCYFDYPPDDGTLQKVYNFNPTGFGFNHKEQANVLGAQANTWTEYIPTERRLEYQDLPRQLALAEVVWGKHDTWQGFSKRMQTQYRVLDALNVNYALPGLQGVANNNAFIDTISVRVINPLPSNQLRYTTDGSTPTLASPLYTKPFVLNNSTVVKMASVKPDGRTSQVYIINYTKVQYKNAVPVANAAPGLTYSVYPGAFKHVADMLKADFKSSAITTGIELPQTTGLDAFGTIHRGYFNAPASGIYTFYLRSDDGSVLKLDKELLINNDGLHSVKELSAQTALRQGLHPFELWFIEGGGGYQLHLQVEGPGIPKRDVRPGDFVYAR